MGIPILGHYRFQRLMVELNVQPLFFYSSCTFSTRYGLEHIGFAFSFNLKSNGSVFQVPSVPSNNSSGCFNNFRNSLRFFSVKCWHWFFVTLFKSAFSYLAYKITCNIFLEIRTCSDLYFFCVIIYKQFFGCNLPCI